MAGQTANVTDDASPDANVFFPDDSPVRDEEISRRQVEDARPSEVVTRTVADALDRDPLDLPPLHDVLDPDALDDLFADTPGGVEREGRLVFECCGCTVAVIGSEEVAVTKND